MQWYLYIWASVKDFIFTLRQFYIQNQLRLEHGQTAQNWQQSVSLGDSLCPSIREIEWKVDRVFQQFLWDALWVVPWSLQRPTEKTAVEIQHTPG